MTLNYRKWTEEKTISLDYALRITRVVTLLGNLTFTKVHVVGSVWFAYFFI